MEAAANLARSEGIMPVSNGFTLHPLAYTAEERFHSRLRASRFPPGWAGAVGSRNAEEGRVLEAATPYLPRRLDSAQPKPAM